ncbi:methyltransferase, partial [Streptomyces sp. NPDC058622]|uniref:methyltransferase family protein n=1 Tax=Streptomyces sp. NPDC058622 TaxID=3346562 RepID=UPI0036551E36
MTTLSTNPAITPTVPVPAHTPQPAMRLRELVFGAACAAAVRAAARLGVADALGDEPATAAGLAAAVDAEPQPLHRLLRALTCYGIFAETEDGAFVHTEMSRLLREDDPHSLRSISLWCTEPWTWEAWPRLDDAVRSGRSVFQDLYGKGFFEYLHQDAHESAHVFNRAMTTSSTQSALDVAELLDLTGVSVVADIGGGQGHVLA